MSNLKAMISSTALDLPEHRKQAFDACLSMGVRPIGMEYLPARDASGVAVSLEMVDQADIFTSAFTPGAMARFQMAARFRSPKWSSIGPWRRERRFSCSSWMTIIR
jgi:hypothetical protein